MSTKIPKWLSSTKYTLSVRPKLEIDDVEEDGTALDTVKHVPPFRYKAAKKAKKRILEAENWISFLKKKGKIVEE